MTGRRLPRGSTSHGFQSGRNLEGPSFLPRTPVGSSVSEWRNSFPATCTERKAGDEGASAICQASDVGCTWWMRRPIWGAEDKASGRHASPAGPPEGIACYPPVDGGCPAPLGALFTTWPPMWGHSSRCFAFGGVSPLLSAADVVQIASTPHAIVFPRREKRSLIPPCGPSIRPRN